MDAKNKYSHRCLLPFNGLKYGTPYSGRPVGNIHEFMPLYKGLNREILHYSRFCCVLGCFVLKGEGNDEEEKYKI